MHSGAFSFVQPNIYRKSHNFLFLFSFSSSDNIGIHLNLSSSFGFVLILNRVTGSKSSIQHHIFGQIFNFLSISLNNFWKYHGLSLDGFKSLIGDLPINWISRYEKWPYRSVGYRYWLIWKKLIGRPLVYAVS